MRKPAKKTARRQPPPAWEVFQIKSTPARFTGLVHADDEKAALARAIKERNVRPADRKRLFARPR